jgi:hypothetical protein
LKVGTGTVGFYGGRFYSPKDTVSKRENDGGKLAPITRGHTAPKSKPFAGDTFGTGKASTSIERNGRVIGQAAIGSHLDTLRLKALQTAERKRREKEEKV